MKTPLSALKQCVHRLLKPRKLSTATHLSRLFATPQLEPQEELMQSAITQLKTTDDWTNNTDLRQQLVSLPPRSLLKIARHLETSNKALKFFHLIHDNPSLSLSPLSLSSVFQAIFELAIREEDSISVVNLLNLSKEIKVPLTPNSAILLIRYFFGLNKVQESVLVYDKLHPDAKNTNIKNALLGVLLKSNRMDDAHQVLDEMLQPDAKFPPNETTLNIIYPVLLSLDRGNEIEKMLGLIPKFGTHGVFPSNVLLAQLIVKLCRSYKHDKAWDLLHELMKFGKVGAGPCNAMLSALGKQRDYERINILLKEMKENDIKPDIVTFGMLMDHLCKFRRVDDALDMLKKMREGSDDLCAKPDVILYNTLIDGLCKVGRQEEGLVLMHQMQQEDNCVPDVITYNCLINGFCKSGEIERAHELLDQMNESGLHPNVISVNTLVDGMCKNGRISNAMEFFRKMQDEKGIKGNVVTYTTLISAFCNANNIENAMRLFDEMESICTPDARLYYSLISGLTQARRLDDASFIVSKMKKAGFQLDIISYNTLISGFCRKKRLDKAVEVLKDMEETGIKPDGVTYNSLISYFSQNGDFGSAHKFMKQMVNDGNAPTVVTYGTLIHAYCLSGNLDDAMSVFNEMLIASKIAPNTVIYNILIDSFCKHGDVEQALSLMDGMLDRDVRPNTTTYNAMLKGLWSKNYLREAFRLMDQMTKFTCNPDYITMEILTNWLSEVGEIQKLKRFVQGYQVSSAANTA